MTIDEAIAHAREFAEKQRKDNENCKYKAEYGCKGCADYFSKPCIECAKEQEQLAEWLEELKELRKIKEDYAKGMQTSYATFMYKKAIDDFADQMKTGETIDYISSYVRFEDIEEYIDNIAKRLKEIRKDEENSL